MRKLLLFGSLLFLLPGCLSEYRFVDAQLPEQLFLDEVLTIEESAEVPAKSLAVVMPGDYEKATEMVTYYNGLGKIKETALVVLLEQVDAEKEIGEISTCRKCAFQTGLGDLLTDKELAKKLIKETGVKNAKEMSFKQAAFVKHTFADVKVLPITVSANVANAQMDELVSWMEMNLPADSLIVAEANFGGMELQKKSALATLSNFDYSNLYDLSVDAPTVLYVLMNYLESLSAFGVNDYPGEIVNFSKSEKAADKGVSILSIGNFVGDEDLMFSSGWRYDPNYDQVADNTSTKYLRDIRGANDEFLVGLDFLIFDLVNDSCRLESQNEMSVAFCKLDKSSDASVLLGEYQELSDLIYVIYDFAGDADGSREKFSELVANGADIVIGRGMEEVYPLQLYGDSLVFQSLGDFVAESKLATELNTSSEGMMIGLYVTEESYEIFAYPLEVVNSYPMFVDNSLVKDIFKDYTKEVDLSESDIYDPDNAHLIIKRSSYVAD